VTDLKPDLEKFNQLLVGSVLGREHKGTDVAGDFRSLFLREPNELSRRVLFMLMNWCGEYEGPPEDNAALQRWAGKREVAALIKAALYADLTTPPTPETNPYE
jgi:hypothetical protein